MTEAQASGDPVALLGRRLPSPRTRRQWGALVALFAAALIFPGLGRRDVVSNAEGQRAVPPIEMLATGDWIVPRLNGHSYLKKPPLLYWEVAALYAVLGVDEWTARLPSAAAGVLLAVVAFLWAAEFGALPVAALAGAFTAANYLVLTKARECQLECGLALFTALAMWLWFRGIRQLSVSSSSSSQSLPSSPARKSFAWAALFLAIANLYKFPVPFIFLLPSWIGATVALRRWRWLARWECWLALLASIAPVALWGAAAIASIGWGRALDVWGHEARIHLREATEIDAAPLWYYGPQLLALFAPWCLLFPVLFARGFWRAQSQRRLAFHFLWTGVAGALVFLSLCPAKHSEYVMGAIVPLNILLAWAWEYWSQSGVGRRLRAAAPGTARQWLAPAVFALLLLGAWIGLALADRRENARESLREFAAQARVALDAGRPLAGYDEPPPPLLYYLRRRVPVVERQAAAMAFLRRHPDGAIVMKAKVQERLQAANPGAAVRVAATAPPKTKLLLIELSRPLP